MNYDEARRVDPKSNRKDAGKWRYTRMNDGRVSAIGYCADGCPGHDTPEEANEHQRQYLLDHLRFLQDSLDADTKHRCQAPGCNEFTSGGADIPGKWWHHWFLCPTHRTRDMVDKHLLPPGSVGATMHS